MKRKELLKQSKKLAAVVATAALLDSGALAVHAAENVNAEAVQSQTGDSDFTQSESETEQVAEPDDNHMEEQQSEGDVAQSEELTETVLTEEQPTETEQVSDQVQQDQTPDQVQGDAAPETDEDTTSETEKQDEAEGILEEDDTEQTESEDTDVSDEKTEENPEDVIDQSQSDNEQNNSTESDEEKSLENAQLVAADGQKGWVEDENGDSSYFEEDGKKVTGLYYIDDKRYYFDNNGILQKNAGTVLIDDEGTGDLHLYCIDENGAVATGWVENSEYGLCYFREDGRAIDSGVQTIDGKKYLFFLYGMRADADCIFSREDENGQMQVYRTDADGVLITGWYQEDDDTKFYYDSEGREAHGIVTIDNKQYYFSDGGVMYTDYSVFQDGKFYYFDNEGIGKVQKNIEKDGWVQVDDSWYYVKSGELVRDEILNLGKKSYYIRYDGKMCQNAFFWAYDEDSDKDYRYYADANGVLVSGWRKVQGDEEEEGGWYYFESDGKGAEGVKTINGATYFFNNGLMRTNYICFENGCIYHFGEDGKQDTAKTVEKDGWVQFDNSWYYVRSGALVRNEILYLGKKSYYIGYDGKMWKDRLCFIYDEDTDTDSIYYVDENGYVVTGWYKMKEEDAWYYFENNGKAADGIKNISGVTYYFIAGRMQTEYATVDNNNFYYFDEKGIAHSREIQGNGWIKCDENWFYIENQKVVRRTFLQLGKYKYYFDENGKMYANSSLSILDEDTEEYFYRFDQSGHMITGWYEDAGGDWYYFGSDGRGVTGFQNIGGKTYYFDQDTYVLVKDKAKVQEGYFYYIDSDGILQTKKAVNGDSWISCNNNWYYIKDGKLLSDSFLTVGKYTYYLDYNGVMVTDTAIGIWNDDEADEDYYRLDSYGHVVTGWFRDNWGDMYYYGTDGKSAQGVIVLNSKVYNFSSQGMLLPDSVAYYDGKVYYFGDDGIGTQIDKNGWIENSIYVENGKVVTGWKKLDGKWYYFSEDTARKLVDGDYEINGSSYYFDEAGIMKTGWIRTGYYDGYNHYVENYLYADANGKLKQDVWMKSGDKWCYFNGVYMAKGIVRIGDVYHSFEADGTWNRQLPSTTNGWIKVASVWYYFENDQLITDETKVIDGKKYCFDDDGNMLVNVRVNNSYYGANGAALKNQWREVTPGTWEYYDSDYQRVNSGWKVINGSKYYFVDNYAVCRDIVIDNVLYHFTTGGALTGSATALVSGWNLINGDYYYFADNKLATGIQKIGKNKYIFAMNGTMLYGRTYNINEADPDLHYYCYLDKNGAMLTDGWSADHEHYANAEGALLTGVQVIDGKSYVFTEYGTLCHNEQIMSIDRKKIYITNARGEVSQTISASKSGWIQDNFKRWYYSQNGTFMKNRKCVIGGKTYYFLWNGEMATNCYVEGGYADKNGVVISNGWSDDHKMYFRNGDYVSGDQTIDGKYYYFNDYDSSNSEGIFRVNGKNYYYDGLGNKTVQTLKTGWNQINSNWCYLNADGTLASGLTKVGSKYYYFGRENGFMKKDYAICQGTAVQRYFGSDGVFFTNGWKEINGLKYYFDQNGHSITGKRHIDGKWYIFDHTGVLIQ